MDKLTITIASVMIDGTHRSYSVEVEPSAGALESALTYVRGFHPDDKVAYRVVMVYACEPVVLVPGRASSRLQHLYHMLRKPDLWFGGA